MVVETQNTHAAAEKLKISQASVSRAIAKLRESFGDQLFIRRAHSLEPSELAIKLAEASTQMLNPVEKVIESYSVFTPQAYTGTVRILANTFLLEFFGPSLIVALHKALPQARFNITQWQKDSLHDVLQGNIDYVIQFASYTMPQDMYCRSLAKIQNVLLARQEHPVLCRSSKWEDINTLPIIRLFLDGINPRRGVLETLYERYGYEANFLLTTHSVRTAVALLKESDAIMYSSEFVAHIDPEIKCYALPPLSEQYNILDINGAYPQTLRGNPLNQYLHQTFQSFFDQTLSIRTPMQ